MKVEEAMIELRKGKSIKKKHMQVYFNKDSMMQICMSPQCLLIDDWEVMEESGKTFSEVFEAFKEGKTIRRKEWPSMAFINICNANDYSEFRDILCNDWEIIE